MCRWSVGNITVNGDNRGPSFNLYGTGKLVWKITRINADLFDADGMTISFSLWKNRDCPQVDKFLAQPAVVALFDKDIKCCPVYQLQLPKVA